MNTRQPLIMNKIQKKLAEVARELELIQADNWAKDIKTTAFAIKQEYEEQRIKEEKERQEDINKKIKKYIPTDKRIKEHIRLMGDYEPLTFDEIKQCCSNPKTIEDLMVIARVQCYKRGWVKHMCNTLNISYKPNYKFTHNNHYYSYTDEEDYGEIQSYEEFDYYDI